MRKLFTLVACGMVSALGPASVRGQGDVAPVASASEPVLRRGDSGDAVRVFQDLLSSARRRAGGRSLTIDGELGAGTASAVKDFQRASGLAPSGVVDAPTWSALHAAVASEPLGSIRPAAPPLAPDVYRREHKGPFEVALHLLPEIETAPGVRARPIVYESKMTIDADGAGDAWKHDPDGQAETSLRYPGGRSLDPTQVPYFVLPVGFEKKHPGSRLGDVAAVVHEGRVAYAIWGDQGPKDMLGEGSIALAKLLGIDPDPVRGGTDAGVFFVVFPGSGDRRPLANDEIDRRGKALLKRSGGNPR
jgi:hypothetical protein